MTCGREARKSRRAAIVLEDVGKRLWTAVSQRRAACREDSPAHLRRYSGIHRAERALRAQTLPDTKIEAPVMARAACDERNTMTSASASGATQRVKSAFGMSARLAGVSMMARK